MQREIYAGLEITENEIRFIVGRYRPNGIMTVIYKEREKGRWLDQDDTILNDKQVTQIVNRWINGFQSKFKQKLNAISLVCPSKTIISKSAIPNITLTPDSSAKKVSPDDIKLLQSKAKEVCFEGDRIVLNVKPIYYVVDNQIVGNQPPLGRTCKFLSMKARVYTIDKKVYNSHRAIITQCDKEILNSTFSAYTLAKQVVPSKDFANNSVVINWAKEGVEISFFAKETLMKSLVLKHGVNYIIDNVANRMGSKKEVANKYLFKLLDFNKGMEDENTVYRKFDQQNRMPLEFKGKDLTKHFVNEIYGIIDKIDILISREFSELRNVHFKIFHTGNIVEVAGFDSLLRRSQFNDVNSIYFSRITGASEIWSTSLCGAIKWISQLNKMKETINTSVGQLQNVTLLEHRQRLVLNMQKQVSARQPNYQNNSNFMPQNGMIKTQVR